MTGKSCFNLDSEIDAAESEEKHQRYEALYSRRLRAKYFSKKALDGGTIKDWAFVQVHPT